MKLHSQYFSSGSFEHKFFICSLILDDLVSSDHLVSTIRAFASSSINLGARIIHHQRHFNQNDPNHNSRTKNTIVSKQLPA